MWTFQIRNVLPPKMYIKAMLWANGFLLAIYACYLLFNKEIFSPILVLGLSIAIVIYYLRGLYKHPQVNEATKSSVWWWEYPLFVVGLIFAATRGSAAVCIFLWGFLYGNGVMLLKYSIAKTKNMKLE